MFTKLFWKDAIERAISTTAQVFLAVGGVDAMGYLNINLRVLLLTSVIGGGLSIVKAIAAAYKSNTDTASFTVDTKELK